MDYLTVLKKLVKIFQSQKIPYMLVGGIATSIYGEPRATKDIDLMVMVKPYHLGKLLSTLKKNKFQFHAEEAKVLLEFGNRIMIYDPTGILRIDLWIPKTNYEKQAFKRRKKEMLKKTTLFTVSVEDLILLKLLAGRPKDIIDIEGILVKKPKLNQNYLRFWGIALNIYDKFQKVSKKVKNKLKALGLA